MQTDKSTDQLVGGRDMMLAFQRLRNHIESQLGEDGASPKVLAGINRLAADLYLGALRQTSSRKAELRRLGVAGGDMDMMRNFVTQARADAHFIAAMKHNEGILDTMATMRKQAANSPEGMALYNEMMLRHVAGMTYKPDNMSQTIKGLTSTFMLTTNPSYYVQNLLQPMLLSQPMIAAKHGWKNAAGGMYDAYKEAWGLRNGLGPLKLDAIKDAKVKEAIEELSRRGNIDIGQDSDLGSFHSLSDKGITKHAAYLHDLLKKATSVTEQTNRVATAITAYRLEKQHLLSEGKSAEEAHAGAVDYAYEVNRQTNGSYDNFNAPRYMRGPVASVMTQFRKFQLMQATLLIRQVGGSKFFTDASKLTKEEVIERGIARRALGFTLGHTALMAGAMGLPGAATGIWVMNNLLSTKDEPADIEESIRKAIGNEALSNILLKGAPTLGKNGIDLSDRVGMGQAFSMLPYADTSIDRKGYTNAITALAGPAIGGVGLRAADGLGLMHEGKYWKGLEKMMPKGISDGMQAYREQTEGVTNRKGDVLIQPDEISFAQSLATTLGFKTTEVSKRQTDSNNEYQTEKHFSERSRELNQKFAAARRSGDSSAMQDVREEFRNLQDARFNAGLKRQSMETLMKYSMLQKQRERDTVDGVQYKHGSPGLRRARDAMDLED
jgi:hypothetical protein